MATNFFLKLDGIEGESTDSKHAKELQILSWSHSFNQPTSPTRSSAGAGTLEQANHSDFSITKYLDCATDDLLQACWSGQQIKTGVFSAYRDAGEKTAQINYLKVDFEGVVISNYSVSGGTGDMPVETVTLSYAKVKYTYTGQNTGDGTTGNNAQPVYHDLVKQEVG